MKKILLGMLVLASVASCKKSKDASCEATVSVMAGNYKITKAVISASGIPDQDVTTSSYTDCERNAVYALKSDKSVVYTEPAGGACGNDGTGTWDVVDSKITLTTNGGSVDFNATPLSSWDCTTFVVNEDFGGATMKTFFTRQ